MNNTGVLEMLRQLSGLAIAIFMMIFASTPAWASTGKKVALVIGNSAYVYSVPLPNPKNDAVLIAETLRSVGFQVIDGNDLDKASMKALIDQFTEAAYDADTAIIYYAGHGLQVDGQNYVVPIDAQLEKAAQLQTRAISINDLINALPPEPAVNIVILDACRDNPLARTLAQALPATRAMGVTKGLARIDANGKNGSGGLLIAYATDPGSVAYDGKDVHSPYSAALARHLTTPGLELQSALTRVRADVADMTKGAQRPWHNASLSREVFLGEPPKPAEAIAVINTTNQPLAAPAPSADWIVEQTLWEEASKRNTIAHYELYLRQFPNGKLAPLARLNIEQLKSADPKSASSKPATTAATAPVPTPSQPAADTPQRVATAVSTPMENGAASQVRTAVALPEEVKNTPGTIATEALLNLDRQRTVDLQLRLAALGHDTGGTDGSLGRRSRVAIGAWQRQLGIIETTFLTPAQYQFLSLQTEPLMPGIRARYEADAARRKQASPRSDDELVERKSQKRSSNAGDDAFVGGFLGGAIGGALGGLIGR